MSSVFAIPRMLLLLVFASAHVKLATCSGQESNADLHKLQEISATYEIVITSVAAQLKFPVRTAHGVIDGRVATQESLKTYEEMFAHEFQLYPASLIRAAAFKQVVLCEELSYAGQRRNAIPDFANHVLYLDVKRGDFNQQYQRKVIHHEFFHLIDFQDDGHVYTDPSWSALNPADIRYGSGGQAAQSTASTSVLTTRYPGFLNHYSTTGVEEDKSEIFANLMVVPKYVEKRADTCPIIQAKVVAMKVLLRKFCPDLDDQFWARVNAVERSDREKPAMP